MSKVLVVVLNVVRGLSLAASVGAAVAAAVKGTGADDGLLYLTVAVTAGLAAVALSPRLWTVDAGVVDPGPVAASSSTTETAAPQSASHPPSTPSQPAAPAPQQPLYPTAAQPGQQHPPATTAQPVATPPGGAGQVYGGGTYQGQVYGQGAPGAAEPQQSPPPEWQQHR